jgi:hypothetical protein
MLGRQLTSSAQISGASGRGCRRCHSRENPPASNAFAVAAAASVPRKSTGTAA